MYSRLPIIRTFKGNRKMFELWRVKLYRKCSEGNENCFEIAGGSSYRGLESPGVDCTGVLLRFKNAIGSRLPPFHYTLLLPLSSICRAEGTTILVRGPSVTSLSTQLNEVARTVSTWADNNRMSLNTTKTKSLLITTLQKRRTLTS